MPGRTTLAVAAVTIALALPLDAHGADAWTLDRVLEEALIANARLPIARADVHIGDASTRGARAALGPRLSLGSDLRYAPGGASYNPAVAPINEERVQLQASQPLYDGGSLHARIRSADAQLHAARARYRVAEREVAFEVRARYAEAIATAAEVSARRVGLARLRAYLSLVRERMAAGQGLEADLLRTDARIVGEEANLTDAERRLAGAKLDVNDLMGRDPSAPLELAPLPPPVAPAAASGEPWSRSPDVAAAEADRAAAAANVDEARAARRPHLDLAFDAGVFGPGWPVPGASPSVAERLRDDLGFSVTLNFSWAFWDLGVYAAQLAQARFKAEQADASVRVTRRQAQLGWRHAEADLEALYGTVQLRARAVPSARDAYVLAESLYRGGAATALDVLAAYAGLVDAQVAEAAALQQYRVAEAQARRWSEP